MSILSVALFLSNRRRGVNRGVLIWLLPTDDWETLDDNIRLRFINSINEKFEDLNSSIFETSFSLLVRCGGNGYCSEVLFIESR